MDECSNTSDSVAMDIFAAACIVVNEFGTLLVCVILHDVYVDVD